MAALEQDIDPRKAVALGLSAEADAAAEPAVATSGLLVPESTCWRIERAGRVAVLVDGAAYFAALRSAILKAEHSVVIVGWDIDSRAPLRPLAEGDADDDSQAPEALGALLAYVVARRPALRIRILLWNYSILYAIERELLPALSLGWQTPPQIEFYFDDMLPLGASHHQKIVVVDDVLAFSGGLDITSRRWDTPAHDPRDVRRVDPAGKSYGPFHDVQMVVDGPAARALGDLVADRWQRATGKTLERCQRSAEEAGELWPTGIAAEFTRVAVGISRTHAGFEDIPEIREVEALFLRSIAAAERLIYIENQYLTAENVAEALCQRLRAAPDLEVVIVGPDEPHGWLEARSMGAGRVRFCRCLERAGVRGRVRLMYPFVTAGAKHVPVMVHAKVTVVDDVLLRVGSANLNNRSMGLDSECDLAIEATDDEQRRAVAAVRDRLLAEHLGVEPAEIGAALAAGSLVALVEHGGVERGGVEGRGKAAAVGPRRGLAPIKDRAEYDDEFGRTIRPIADPERPIDSDELIGGMYGAAPARTRFRRLAMLAAAAGVLLGLMLLWHFTPLADVIAPGTLVPRLDSVAGEPWAPFALLAAFVVGGFLVFPVTILIALTAMTFGPWQGLAYAAVGSLLSAGLTYQAGRMGSRRWLRGLMGPRIEKVSRRLGKQGVLSVLILRLVPVAPFTFINLIAGASQIRFRDFLIGTVLGMAPGIVIMTVLGDRLRQLWQDPSWTQMGLLGVVVVFWFAVSLAVQRAVSRRRG
jgi:phosphatidylserine/phosphatidylglycerophosphate/cardiolipin synthase-like enzyme/uncharacterized membrane protein YdjX (TVP38/TMEM64 family)